MPALWTEIRLLSDRNPLRFSRGVVAHGKSSPDIWFGDLGGQLQHELTPVRRNG